jgi:hypothetical protein
MDAIGELRDNHKSVRHDNRIDYCDIGCNRIQLCRLLRQQAIIVKVVENLRLIKLFDSLLNGDQQRLTADRLMFQLLPP